MELAVGRTMSDSKAGAACQALVAAGPEVVALHPLVWGMGMGMGM